MTDLTLSREDREAVQLLARRVDARDTAAFLRTFLHSDHPYVVLLREAFTPARLARVTRMAESCEGAATAGRRIA